MRGISTIGSAVVQALVLAVAAATAVSAQTVITTAVGKGEMIATAVDQGSGDVYFAGDRPGAIFKLTGPYGGVQIAGAPGGSLADGIPAAQAAVFPVRNGLAVDAGGNVFFSEPARHRIRRIDAATGIVTTVAGNGGFASQPNFFDGNNAIFTPIPAPGALAFDPTTGDLLVADETWDVVYRVTGNGSPITSGNGFVYRAVGGDPSNTSIFVENRWYNPFGYAGDNGPALDAKLNHPRGLAFDPSGDLFIADTGNNVVRRVDASTKVITTVTGNGAAGFAGDGGPGASAELFMPSGVAVVGNRYLYIADTSNHRLRIQDLAFGNIDTYLGDGIARYGDYSFAFPTGVASSGHSWFFVVDSQNRSLAIIDPNADSSTPKTEVAHIGDPGDPGYIGDGAPGGDAVNQPAAVVFDTQGNAFFSDSGNARVRRVDAGTHAVTTVAGTGVPGYGGDNGDALHAQLNCPAGLAFGSAGELFVADACASVVRRIAPGADGVITGAADEIITTYAGTGVLYGYNDGSGGPATAARLNAPTTLAMQNGTLFIGEPGIFELRTVAPDGTIRDPQSDIAVNAFTVDAQGHFILAESVEARDIQCDFSEVLYTPDVGLNIGRWGGAAVDSLGRLYLTRADTGGQQVYRFAGPNGTSFCSSPQTPDVVLLAGAGAIGYSGDNGPASSATLNNPAGLAVDAANNVWIADSGNNVIRRLEQPSLGVTASPASLDFGTRALQTTSAAQSATAKATGTASVSFSTTTLAGANPGDFIIVADGCAAAVVTPGGLCSVSVAFRPTAAGARSATLSFNDSASGAPQTVTLTGSGATLDVSPSSLSFAAQTQSLPSAATPVTVINQGTSPVSIVSLSFSGQNPGDFSVTGDGCTGAALAAHGSCAFGVVFTPQGVGPRSATLSITSSASDLVRAVDVSGTGTPPVPAAGVAPGAVAFAKTTIGGKSSPTTITVTSIGTAPLSIASAALTGNQTVDFTLTSDTCSGATLSPSQTCSVTVVFAPVEFCGSTAAVTFTDNASDSPQAVSLSGQSVSGPATAFQATLYCTSHAAQPQELAAASDGNVWFAERGSVFAPGAVARANATAGVINEDPHVVQNLWHPSALATASDGSYAFIESRGGGFNEWYDIVNPIGLKIQQPVVIPGPSGVGSDEGFWLTDRFTCADNFLFQHFAPNAGTTTVVPDAGWIFFSTNHKSCLAPSFVAPGPDGTMWIGSSNQGPDVGTNAPNGFVRVTVDNLPVDITALSAPPAAATVGPDGNMWALVANLGVQSCSLQQISPQVKTSPLALQQPVVALGCFSIVAGPDNRLWMTGTVFNGTTFVEALVAYEPVSKQWSAYPVPSINSANIYLAAGPDEGIWYDAVPSAVGRFDIGGGPSAAYVMPRVVAFPSTIAGLPSPGRSIVVRSTGTQALTISGVNLAGPNASQFIVVNDGCSGLSLAPGGTCSVEVASLPTQPGNHVAQLVIADNDAFGPQVVRLAAYSLPKGPTIDPSSAAFPAAVVGQHGTTVTFTLTNPFDHDLAVNSVSPGGANPGDFTMLSNTCAGTSVPANGGTCTVAMRFDPTVAGTRKATLTFTDAANPPTQVVTLTGGGHNQTTTGTCACSSTGLFRDPQIVYPALVSTVGSSGTSPHGTYTLDVQSSGGKPTAFVITKKGSSTPLVTINAPTPATTVWPGERQYAWGFSPDDDRFVLHYATFQVTGATTTDWIDAIALYDLTSTTPGVAVKTETLPIAPDGSASGPSGSAAFSPNGTYLLTAQLQSTASNQSISLNIIATDGHSVYQNVWSPATAPADPSATAGSAHWGFAPDDGTFAYYLLEPGDDPTLLLIALPAGGAPVLQYHNSAATVTKAQFSPCGDLFAIADVSSQSNPVTVSLYSTRPGQSGAIATKGDLPAADPTINAGSEYYTVTAEGWPNAVRLLPNSSAGSCPPPTTSGDAGGSDAPAKAVPPAFKETFDLQTPPRTATLGQLYSHTFTATGTPAPTFEFLTNTCSFLSIDENTGEVSGTPATAFASCAYSLTAANGAGNANAGPFTITMTTAPGGGGTGGPYEPDDEVALERAAPVSAHESSTAGAAPSAIGAATTLVLPHGRGRIVLHDDVTPSVSTFTYTENDAPAGPVGALTFAGLDFSLVAVDAATGAPVAAFVDPPVATIAYRPADLQSARIHDPATLSLYWWNGSAWVSQMPCAGCGVDPADGTLTVNLTQPGEYMLAAAQPALTIPLTALPLTTTIGAPFSGPLATFAPIAATDPVGFYTATVNWGDGQITEGPISSSGAATFVVSGAHTWAAPGTFTVVVTVQQGSSHGTTQIAAVVNPVGQAPHFTAAAPPVSATVGVPYSYSFAATGVPAPSFALASGAPSWLSIGAASGIVSGTPPAGATSFTYSVVASNGVAPSAAAGPFLVAVNAPPHFTAVSPPLSVNAGAAYSYTFAASGVPAPAFALASGAPSWLSIGAASGIVSGTPPAGTTSFIYSVVASNGVAPNAVAGPFTVNVVSTGNGSADLSVAISAPVKATRGSTVTYTIVVTNHGPSSARNLDLLLLAGPGLSYVSASPAPLIAADGLWDWTLATLGSGQSATFTLKVKAMKADNVLAAAVVVSATPDTKLGNNAALVWTAVK